MDDLVQIVESAKADFAAAEQPAALEDAKARYLGKNGSLTALMKGLSKLSVEESAPAVRPSTAPRARSRPRSRRAARRSLKWRCKRSLPPKRST